MHKSYAVNRLYKTICSGDIVILCGAGISRDSGLPVVAKLIPFILKTLNATEQEVAVITKAQLPFEAFIDTIASETSISKLLNIFRGGMPNATHALLAELVKRGFVRTICTTNFDTLIEAALANTGLSAGVDFKVLSQESDFDEIELHRHIPILIKLHGCISNEQQLAISIRNVANKVSVDSRARVIKHLFSNGQHGEVLVLGYSCSDTFDVFPAISSINKHFKRVSFISHVSKPTNELDLKAEDIRNQGDTNPFAKFPNGERIFCKTSWFVSQLWQCCFKKKIQPTKLQPENWKHHIEQWSRQAPRGKTGPIFHNILGRLLARLSEYQLALNRHRSAFTEARDSGQFNEAAHTLNLLGSAYGHLSHLKESEECFLNAKIEAERLKNVSVELSALGNLGILSDQLGEHSKSIEYTKRSLYLAKNMKDFDLVSSLTGKLGVSHSLLGEYSKAIKYYKMALEYSVERGDKYQEQNLLGNLGVAYRRMGNTKDALRLFERALEISRKLTDWINEFNALHALGNIYIDLKKYVDAQNAFLKAKEIAEQKSLDVQLASALDGLGLIHYCRDEHQEAIKLFESALEINMRLGAIMSQQKCLDHIGISFSKLGKFRLALKYHQDALEIAELIGNEENIAIIRANIAYALAGIGQTELAMQHYDKSLAVLRQRLGDEHPIVKEIQADLRESTNR